MTRASSNGTPLKSTRHTLMHDCLVVCPVKDCPELLRSLPLFSDDSFGTRPGGIHALFSV